MRQVQKEKAGLVQIKREAKGVKRSIWKREGN